jgi:TorA maturation chaperone TorD
MTVSQDDVQVVALRAPLPPEEQARADVYALLATLWSGAPDAGLLDARGRLPRLPEEAGSGWPPAFNRLADASSVMDAQAAEQEYTDLFIGVGKSEVELRASFWLAGELRDRHLADLRGELAALRLGRRAGSQRTEDQVGPLLETMRILVAGNGELAPARVAVQRAFFERWISPWMDDCCDAIELCPIANYYRRVAECTKMFLAIERDSFAID